MIISIGLLALLGFAASLYVYYLERKLVGDPTFKPFCNLSDKVSCTKPIASPYGTTFGISNGILGLIFYASIGIAALLHATMFIWYASLVACIASVYFAYILFFKIQSACIVCISIYLINIGLLVIASLYYF